VNGRASFPMNRGYALPTNVRLLGHWAFLAGCWILRGTPNIQQEISNAQVADPAVGINCCPRGTGSLLYVVGCPCNPSAPPRAAPSTQAQGEPFDFAQRLRRQAARATHPSSLTTEDGRAESVMVRHDSAPFQRVKAPRRSGLHGPGSYPDAGSRSKRPTAKLGRQTADESPSASVQAAAKAKADEAPKVAIRMPTLP